MNIDTRTINQVTVVTLRGELDGRTTPAVQEQILPLARAGSKIVLDLSKVVYMSSAGLRLLLMFYRQMFTFSGRMVLVGLSEQIQDAMSITGFLSYFTVHNTVEEGIADLS